MQYKQFIDQLSTAVCALTLKAHVVYLNSAAENILQISSQRAMQLPLSKIASLPDGLFDKLLEIGQNMQPFAQRESIWFIHNQAITMDIVVTPVISENEVAHLIVELQVVDRILKISRDEKTHHSHQAHRALIRGLAHEVKNPLGAIRGAAQLLARCIHQELHEYTDVIIQEVDRLSKLVDSMLGPRTPLDVKTCNIHEIIEHVLRLKTVEAESQNLAHQVTISRRYDLSLPEITADRDRLIQAILNITTNAKQALLGTQQDNTRNSEFSQPKTITITTQVARQLTLHHRLHRLAIRIIIEDNGPGIPEDLMLSLFYPLVSGRAEGSGIGLSVAQHIIQQHGGIIECKSSPGCTQFHILIPAHFLPLPST